MNYKKFLTATSAVAISLGFALNANTVFAVSSNDSASSNSSVTNKTDKDADKDSKNEENKKKQPLQELTSYNIMTKIAGAKNYKVWKTVSKGKVHTKVADGINFRYNHIQSNQSIKTKKYTYWLIYVDGRRVGWVNERYFAKNKIEVPKTVSLVRNDTTYTFDPKDAISYVTDDTGTVVDNELVTVSNDSIDCSEPKTYNVEYSYGSAKAKTKVTVRRSTSEGIADANAVTPKKGTSEYETTKQYYGSSLNYISPTQYTPETVKHSFRSGDLTFKTRLYQPVLLSVKTDADDGNINRVGHIPEGVTVSNGWAYTSLLSHTNLVQGHIVGYNLNKLKSIYNAQNLLTMSQKKFNTYVKNIKVSPYIPIGHGQALGSTDKYVYAIVNDHTKKKSADSEELVQIRKCDMCINKIWTIKCWNGDSSSPRYFQNGVVVSDKQMYGVYYDSEKDRYEYWELNRTGDNWYPTIVGATEGKFVKNNSPVQGFTYDTVNKNFYLGFNDLLFKISRAGDVNKAYQLNTGREMEGVSVSNNRIYINLAQRAELLESNKIK